MVNQFEIVFTFICLFSIEYNIVNEENILSIHAEVPSKLRVNYAKWRLFPNLFCFVLKWNNMSIKIFSEVLLLLFTVSFFFVIIYYLIYFLNLF